MRTASLFLLLTALWGEAAGPVWCQDARALLSRARDHHVAGRWEQALAAYEAAALAAQTRDPATTDLDTAGTAYNNRCVLLTDQAEYRAALSDCERALELRRELAEHRALARTLNNFGLVLQYLGRYDEARASFQEALDLNGRREDLAAIAVNQSNLGNLAIAAGDYERALWHLAQAEEVSGQASGEPWAAEQLRIVRLNRGVVFEKLGAYREALELYRELMVESERMDPAHRATLEVNMGVLYRNLGDPVTAIERFDRAEAVFVELRDDAALSNALLNEALARHHNLRELDEAEDLYREALELARRSGDRFEEMQDLFYLGELLRERGRLPEAELVFARGLEVAEVSGSAEGRWSCLQGLGETAFAAGRPHEALKSLLEAIDEIERVRASLRQESRRVGYFGGKRPVYASAVSVLAQLERDEPDRGHAERALEIVQRAKARELVEAMGEHMAPRSAEALRSRAGTARVFELFLAGSRLYAWIIEADRLEMMDLGDARPLQSWVIGIHAALAAGREPPQRMIRALSDVLVERTGLLVDSPEDLRIAPDGHLFYLPFELLEDRATGRSLVERVAISYLPCASLLPGTDAGSRSEPRPAGIRFLGFGNPRLPTDSTAPTSGGLLLSRFQLRPLPGSERELATVARVLAGESRIYVGEDATEATFRREATRGAHVIHLATHTLVDERLDGVAGAGTAVLMTPSDDDNGLLTPAEIAALDLQADLTVLASCRSALGSGDGHALASLTGSLLAAGSASVVATLWDVEDEAAAVFMEQLYYDLGRGLAPAAALRAAKRRLRAHPRWGSPHLWAGYVLVGEAPPVVADDRIPLWGWALLALATVAALTWWLSRSGPSSPHSMDRRRRAPRSAGGRL